MLQVKSRGFKTSSWYSHYTSCASLVKDGMLLLSTCKCVALLDACHAHMKD